MAEKIIIHEPTKSEFKRMAIQLGYELVVQCKDCKHFDRANSIARVLKYVRQAVWISRLLITAPTANERT